jgi:hypothetical protein
MGQTGINVTARVVKAEFESAGAHAILNLMSRTGIHIPAQRAAGLNF